MRKIRLGLDFRRRSNDGVGRVTSLIFEALLTLRPDLEIVVFGASDLPRTINFKDVEFISFDYPIISEKASDSLSRLVQLAKLDVFIGPQFYVLPNLPCRFVSILHDAYPFHSDGLVPTMEELLELFGESSLLRLRQDLGDHVSNGWAISDEDAVLALYHGMYEINAVQASRIATVSEHSMVDLTARFPAAAGRIDIISPFVSTKLVRTPAPDLGSEAIELMHVGKWEPRKRHPLLITAVELCRQDIPDLRLHLVGAAWMAHLSYASTIRDKLIRGQESGWLRWSQSISDDELANSYRSARATVLVPSFEGFGLPALEAMTMGSPLATTGNGALSEICRHADLRLPEDPEGMAAKLCNIWKDDSLRSTLRRRGLDRSRAYSVQRTCSELRSCLNKALEVSTF